MDDLAPLKTGDLFSLAVQSNELAEEADGLRNSQSTASSDHQVRSLSSNDVSTGFKRSLHALRMTGLRLLSVGRR